MRWDFETKHLEQIGSLWFEYVNDVGASENCPTMAKRREREKTDELPGEKVLEDFYEHFNYLKQVGIEGLRGNADEYANVTRKRKIIKKNKEE